MVSWQYWGDLPKREHLLNLCCLISFLCDFLSTHHTLFVTFHNNKGLHTIHHTCPISEIISIHQLPYYNFDWRKREYGLALNWSLEQFRIVHQLLSSLGNGSRQRQSFLRRLRRTNVPRNHSFWPQSPISCFHSNVIRNHSSWPCQTVSLCSTSKSCWDPRAGPLLGSFCAGHCGT